MLGGKNKQPRQPLGYTIVEVLMVLAVSGMLFVIAANFINGKQARASFTQGINEMASQIQNVSEQVSNGKFSDIPLTCTFNGVATAINSGVNNQGTNSSCVFIGKLIRFVPGGSTYKVISLAGGRTIVDISGHQTTPDITNVHPAVADALTTNQTVPQYLTVKSVTVNNAINTDNFGFAQGLGAVTGGSFESGAQTVAMIYSTAGVGSLDSAINNHVAYANGAVVCITDGQRYAQITVGGSTNNASQLNVNVKVVPTC